MVQTAKAPKPGAWLRTTKLATHGRVRDRAASAPETMDVVTQAPDHIAPPHHQAAHNSSAHKPPAHGSKAHTAQAHAQAVHARLHTHSTHVSAPHPAASHAASSHSAVSHARLGHGGDARSAPVAGSVPASAEAVINNDIGGACASMGGLSVRAINVLKELAVELMGETPPHGGWTPPPELARQLTFKRLLTTRNCGPQTLSEIVKWAERQGVTIEPLFHTGKSLSVMWRDVSARFSSGETGRAEIIQALEKSMRRRNTRIPVAFQAIILQLLTSL